MENGERYLSEKELKILLAAHVPLITGLLAMQNPLVVGLACGVTAPAAGLAYYFRNDKTNGNFNRFLSQSCVMASGTLLGAAMTAGELQLVF